MDDAPITIAIARTGTFRDSRGAEHTFTASDLDEIAANYAAAPESAPLVFGHPEDNHPAYGWAKRVFRHGEKLFVQLVQVADKVREAVRKGHYKHVSMSLHPGGKRLRHIGLLGAVPPAISGLGPVEMSSNDFLTLNFAAADLDADNDSKGAMTMGPEDIKRLGALEEQVKELTQQVQTLTAERDKAKADADEAQKKADEATNGQAEAAKEAETVKAEFAAFKGEHQKSARAARLEKLVKDGRLTPGESKDALAQAEALALIPQPMEFSNGEKLTPEENFWRCLEKREVSPLLGASTPPADFAAQGGTGTASAAVDLSKKI